MNNVSSGSGASNSLLSGFSSTARITGLSGFDTDSMVKQLMQAEKIPLNNLMQKRTLTQWKQDSYRDVINTLNGFKSTYFDVVNKSTYVLSPDAVKALKATSSSTSYLNVSASSDAQIGTQNVKVLQVATADTAVTQSKLSKDITGTVAAFNLSGKKINVTLDGVSKDIALDNYSTVGTDPNYIVTDLKASLDAAFGSGKISVAFDGTKLTLGTTGGATQVTVRPPVDSLSGLDDLGFTDGSSSRINVYASLADLKDLFNVPMTFSGGGTVDFTINGKLISADATDSLSEVFDKINNTPEANVTIKYDQSTDKVSIISKQMGAGNNLSLSDINGNFLAAMGIDTANPVTSQGQDAKILINGTQTITRSTNSFTVNGINYDLKAQHPNDSAGDSVTIDQDVDTAYNNIKTFIDKYNDLLGKLNAKINEKYDRDYPPLTDDQKASMKDTDITNWEAKAKTGLLANDSTIQNMIGNIRKAMYDPVDGTNLTLSSIGISSSSYLDEGKLSIDENKLKEALRTNPDQVAKLLNGVDPDNKTYSRIATPEQRDSRYKKSGLFQRISDIINDNVSTYRDSGNNKGTLLMKAGLTGDYSETHNILSDELKDYDDRITQMKDALTTKEDNYYQKFSAMESYLQQMNQQSAWLAKQFSSGG